MNKPKAGDLILVENERGKKFEVKEVIATSSNSSSDDWKVLVKRSPRWYKKDRGTVWLGSWLCGGFVDENYIEAKLPEKSRRIK